MRSGGALGDELVPHGGGTHKLFFILILFPLPRGVPGEGPNCHFLFKVGGFGPDPGGLIYF